MEQIRAYVVEDITTMAEVIVPQNLVRDFKKSTLWPKGQVEILIGMEQQSIHPKLIEINNNLAVFKSYFSTNTILGGDTRRSRRRGPVTPNHTTS